MKQIVALGAASHLDQGILFQVANPEGKSRSNIVVIGMATNQILGAPHPIVTLERLLALTIKECLMQVRNYFSGYSL